LTLTTDYIGLLGTLSDALDLSSLQGGMLVQIDKYKIITEPTEEGRYALYLNRYWVLDEDDNILKCRGASWQCNKHKRVGDTLIKSDNHPGVKVVFFPKMWVKHKE